MAKYKFEDDPMFAPAVKSGHLKEEGGDVYWLNGTGAEHSAFLKLIGDHKTRQQGCEKAVYGLACNPDGSHRFKGKVGISEFHDNVDHAKAREYGMMIMGLSSKDDEKTEFEEEVNDELGNSEKGEQVSTS